MTIKNTLVVDNTSKHIVKSQGIGGEIDQVVIDAEKTYRWYKQITSKFN